MSKLIKLTAVVSALAMLFVCLAVPAMAEETVMFSDNFNWGTKEVDYFTNSTGNLVYKEGSSISGTTATVNSSDSSTFGYYTKGLTSPTTEIVDDPDKDSQRGQVLHYTAAPTTKVNRGVFLDIPTANHVDGYTSIEYDYRPETGGDLSMIIATMPKGGDNNSINWNSFNNFLNEQGPYLYGTYNYDNNGTISSKTFEKGLTWSNYLPADLLEDDGTLKKETWHNIKYVYDPNTVTYDLYVDGYLIIAGCGRYGSDFDKSTNADVNRKGAVVARILLGGKKGAKGESSFGAYYDNFKVKKLEEADVYAARKAAFEKKINCAENSTEGVIYAKERLTVASGYQGIYLPYQGGFGMNTIEHGAYRLVDSAGDVIADTSDKAPISYSDVSYDAVTTAATTRTSKWSGVNLTQRTLNVTKDAGLALETLLSGLNNTYTSGASWGAESYIGFSHFKGNVAEPKLKLTVDFSNGNGDRFTDAKKTYTITFRRDLANDLQDDIEIYAVNGGWDGIENGILTTKSSVNYNTYIGNNSNELVTVFGAMVFYDTAGNVLATVAKELSVPANTDVAAGTSCQLRLGNGNLYYRDETTGGWTKYKSGTSPAGVETFYALESLYKDVKEKTVKVRVFIWQKDTFKPLMTDAVSEAAE